MTNVILFFNGTLFSYVAFELFRNSMIVFVISGRGSLKSNLFYAYSISFFSSAVSPWLVAIALKKFRFKTLLFLSDFLMSGFLFSLVLYMSFFSFGTISCLVFLLIGSLIMGFSNTLNKLSIPLLIPGNTGKLRLNSFDVSIKNISRLLLPFLIFWINSDRLLAICILVSSVFFLISGIAKYHLVIPKIDFSSKKEPFKERRKINIFGSYIMYLLLGCTLLAITFNIVFSSAIIPNILKGSESTIPGWMDRLSFFFVEGETNLYRGLYVLIRFTSAFGALLSFIVLNKFVAKYSCMDGVKFNNYCLIALSFLTSFIIFFFHVLGKGTSNQLFLCLIFANILFNFVLNAYVAYLSHLYQTMLPYKELAWFVPIFMSVSSVLYGIFHFVFNYIGKQGPFYFMIILIISGILNLFIFKEFEKFLAYCMKWNEERKKQNLEELKEEMKKK